MNAINGLIKVGLNDLNLNVIFPFSMTKLLKHY